MTARLALSPDPVPPGSVAELTISYTLDHYPAVNYPDTFPPDQKIGVHGYVKEFRRSDGGFAVVAGDSA